MVLIRDRENQDVEVEAVSTDDPAILCQWTKGPGAMSTVKIKFDPDINLEKSWQSTVRVQVAKPIRQTLLIPVTATRP
jgi:hypothetical protein